MNIPNLDRETRDALIKVLMKPSEDTPTDDEIREVVAEGTDALTANWRFRFMGYKGKNIELALQRATDRGILILGSDWRLKVA